MDLLMLIYFYPFRLKSSVFGDSILRAWYEKQFQACFVSHIYNRIQMYIWRRVFGSSAKERPKNRFILPFLWIKLVITWRHYLSRLICKDSNAPMFFPFMLSEKYSGVSVPCLTFYSLMKLISVISSIQYSIFLITCFKGI